MRWQTKGETALGDADALENTRVAVDHVQVHGSAIGLSCPLTPTIPRYFSQELRCENSRKLIGLCDSMAIQPVYLAPNFSDDWLSHLSEIRGSRDRALDGLKTCLQHSERRY